MIRLKDTEGKKERHKVKKENRSVQVDSIPVYTSLTVMDSLRGKLTEVMTKIKAVKTVYTDNMEEDRGI